MAGGVAIYTVLPNGEVIETDLNTKKQVIENNIGDMRLVEIMLNDKPRFALWCFYLDITLSDLKLFLFRAMVRYSENTKKIFDIMVVDTVVPMVIMGDVNTYTHTNLHALGFMKKHFNLDYVPM